MAKKNEIELENKDMYVEIEPLDSIGLKRTLLEITASVINMQIIAERFKEKTRHEIKDRTAAKKHARDTINSINELIEKLPKVKEMPASVKREIAETLIGKEPVEKTEKPKRDVFSRELEEIKRKIANLS